MGDKNKPLVLDNVDWGARLNNLTQQQAPTTNALLSDRAFAVPFPAFPSTLNEEQPPPHSHKRSLQFGEIQYIPEYATKEECQYRVYAVGNDVITRDHGLEKLEIILATIYPIVDVVSGPYAACLLLDVDGVVTCFTCGEEDSGLGRDGPLDCFLPITKIKNPSKVACGNHHMAFLVNGVLHFAGRYLYMDGRTTPTFKEPFRVTIPGCDDGMILDVCCGQNDTSVLTKNSRVFLFGDIAHQYGIFVRDLCAPFREIKLPDGIPSKIFGNFGTYVIQDQAHRYFGFGNNKYQQISSKAKYENAVFKNLSLVTQPTLMEFPCPVDRIVFGLKHALARVPGGGLLVKGDGSHGELGLGSKTSYNIWKPCDFFVDAAAGASGGAKRWDDAIQLKDIYASVSASAVTTEWGSALMFGSSFDGKLGTYPVGQDIAKPQRPMIDFGQAGVITHLALLHSSTLVVTDVGTPMEDFALMEDVAAKAYIVRRPDLEGAMCDRIPKRDLMLATQLNNLSNIEGPGTRRCTVCGRGGNPGHTCRWCKQPILDLGALNAATYVHPLALTQLNAEARRAIQPVVGRVPHLARSVNSALIPNTVFEEDGVMPEFLYIELKEHHNRAQRAPKDAPSVESQAPASEPPRKRYRAAEKKE